MWIVAGALATAMVALACTTSADTNSTSRGGPPSAATPDPSAPASFVVTSPAAEPYEDANLGPMRFYLVGDPFIKNDYARRTVPMSDFFYGGVSRDGKPAILEPKFESSAQADNWLDPGEPVMLLDLNGDVRAYPVQILLFHELVNDEVGGQPVLVGY